MLYVSPTKDRNGMYDYQFSPVPFPQLPEGFFLVPTGLEEKALAYLPFLKLTINNGAITSIEDNTDARVAANCKTIDEIRAQASARIDGCCSAAIASGVTVNKLHYPLTTLAQLDLKALADAGKDDLYHAAGEAQRLYSAAEFAAIAAAAKEWATVNTTYYDLLKTWVARETDPDKLDAIKYGSKLPDDLMTQLTDLCKSVSIDITKYAALFTA